MSAVTGRPVLLVAASAPRRDDKTPEADWSAVTSLIAWAEGHGRCGGLQPSPEGLRCLCGHLAYDITDPSGEAA